MIRFFIRLIRFCLVFVSLSARGGSPSKQKDLDTQVYCGSTAEGCLSDNAALIVLLLRRNWSDLKDKMIEMLPDAKKNGLGLMLVKTDQTDFSQIRIFFGDKGLIKKHDRRPSHVFDFSEKPRKKAYPYMNFLFTVPKYLSAECDEHILKIVRNFKEIKKRECDVPYIWSNPPDNEKHSCYCLVQKLEPSIVSIVSLIESMIGHRPFECIFYGSSISGDVRKEIYPLITDPPGTTGLCKINLVEGSLNDLAKDISQDIAPFERNAYGATDKAEIGANVTAQTHQKSAASDIQDANFHDSVGTASPGIQGKFRLSSVKISELERVNAEGKPNSGKEEPPPKVDEVIDKAKVDEFDKGKVDGLIDKGKSLIIFSVESIISALKSILNAFLSIFGL